MKDRIWLSSPHIGKKEMYWVQQAFATNWIAPLGPNVTGFEEELGDSLGSRVEVAALSSGTAALHLALVLLGVGRGDEVICQSMTFAASANPVVYQGATPVFVDSEEATWNMSPQFLEQAIKDRLRKRKKPKAIIVVHLYGMPAMMDEISAIASRYGIPLIEDAAEALGSTYKGKPVGTMGDLGIFSFNGNKIITTSGGGALVSANGKYIEEARFLATQALDPAPHYQHSRTGYNYRMSNVCAGIGRGQLEVLANRVQSRRRNFFYYQLALGSLEKVHFHEEPSWEFFSNYWLTTLIFEEGNEMREEIRQMLLANNIDCRPLWKPMHLQPLFETAPYYGEGVSERLFEQGLCLPSGSNLTESELNRVIALIYESFKATV
ncbi:DegT/DnrJ/EryC1/StrS family aminotransferase [Pseudoflavitalea rhizosphaerae]|uniref:DegT/DnrJ/EryC1/StrS family aminotransferase n=1 Tax=Pseudoflavitalea rhizosphaerae TaxID=1884793 RepID=UPI000F8C6472|nr:aminotransferase class I/II-fold pyridoxal phosphate-dependent enzyme [Pseudoflavitalea rhizosphaerae]